MSQPNDFQYIHAIQGDNDGEIVYATLYDKNQIYDASGCNTKVLIKGYTQSGHAILGEASLDTGTSIVSFNLNRELFCSAGKNTIFLELSDKDNPSIIKSSFPFVIHVIADPVSSISQPQLTLITDYVRRAETAAEKSEQYYNQLISEKGQPNGIATLDGNGHVPRIQLPNDLIHVIISDIQSEPEQLPGDFWIIENDTNS